MGFASGTVDVGDGSVLVCTVPEDGVLVKNLGGSRVFFGGPQVGVDGTAAGFAVDPGETQLVPGVKAKESPVVPAPPGDMDAAELYARTAPGSGVARVAWISVA